MNIVVMNAWQIVLKGGPMMWPILLLSITALAIGINRMMLLTKTERKLLVDKQILLESLRQGRLKDTMRLCESQDGILSGILREGILKFGSSRDLIKGSMEEIFEHETSKIKEHMGILSAIVNIAPLVGLLGTVNAMTVVFHAVVIRSNVLNPLTAGELATGIWQALLTTAAGLLVAILSYAVYTFCAMRINVIIVHIERLIVEMTNILQQLSELKDAGERENDA